MPNKHRSIQSTVIPPTYCVHHSPKQQTVAFNKWAMYINREVKLIEKKN